MQERIEKTSARVAKFKYSRRSTVGSVGIQEALDSTLFICFLLKKDKIRFVCELNFVCSCT